MGPKQVFAVGATIVALLVVTLFAGSIFETNEAGYVQVKQAFYWGDLTVRSEPGTYGQMFGTIHTYKEASTFHFTKDSDSGEARDQSLPTQYNDGAKAMVSGSVRVLLPNTDGESMIKVHRKFKSMGGVMNRLVLPAMRKALFASGPHMSAAESYAERRNEFAALVENQLLYGTIATEKEAIIVVDEITDKEKTTYRLRKVKCDNVEDVNCVQGFLREQQSVFHEFNIRLTNFAIDNIVYPQNVLAQIETQRAARMNIITKEAEAKEADARAKKAEAEARAQVAETRAVEEVQKTQFIVRAEAAKEQAILQAEQVKAVAQLEKEAATFTKQKNILLGEGEATRKRLVMNADGALAQKLEAWVTAQQAYAAALGNAKPGALVPQMVMTSGSGGKTASGGNGTLFMDLFTAKTARDLSLDMKMSGNTAQ